MEAGPRGRVEDLPDEKEGSCLFPAVSCNAYVEPGAGDRMAGVEFFDRGAGGALARTGEDQTDPAAVVRAEAVGTRLEPKPEGGRERPGFGGKGDDYVEHGALSSGKADQRVRRVSLHGEPDQQAEDGGTSG